MGELAHDGYSFSLFELAVEDKIESQIHSELVGIDELLTTNHEYQKLLSSPALGMEQKHELIQSAFGGKVNSYLLNLMFILADHNRFASFHSILNGYCDLLDKHNNVMRVKAITAIKLSDKLIQKLQEKLCQQLKKQVIVSNEVDESLIGGILLRYNNLELDATVKSELDNIKKQIRAVTL